MKSSQLSGLAVLLAALFALVPNASSQGCLHYEDHLNWVGELLLAPAGNDPHGYGNLAVVDDFAFVWRLERGLNIVDVSNPEAPQRISELRLGAYESDIAVAGDYAYLVGGGGYTSPGSLWVVNVAEPTTPQVTASLALPTKGSGIAVDGIYAFVADTDHGFLVINVLDPESPEIIGWVDTPGRAYDVAVSGNFAYVADGANGLQIIDISTVSSPFIADAVDTPGLARGVSVSGNIACVADGVHGLQVIEICWPAGPQLVGSLEIPEMTDDVLIDGDVCFVASSGVNGLKTVDISQPDSPILIGESGMSRGAPGDLALTDDLLYVGEYAWQMEGVSDAGLEIFDVSNPASAPLRGEQVSLSPGRHVCRGFGDYAYMTNWYALYTFDVQDPAAPVYVDGDAVTDGGSDLEIGAAGDFLALPIAGGVQFLDLDDPADPEIRGVISLPDSPSDIAVHDPYVYAVYDQQYLAVIDASDLDDPQLVSTTPATYPRSVAVSGDFVCTGSISGVLEIFDASTPEAPLYMGTTSIPGEIAGMIVSGNHAYLATRTDGLKVVSITDPTAPESVGNCHFPGFGFEVSVSGSHAYVASYSAGVNVFDVSDPSAPLHLGGIPTWLWCGSVAAIGDRIYASGHYGLQIAWSQCGSSGIDQGEGHERFQLVSAAPNPFTEGTAISLTMNTAEQLDVGVFDVTGRRVALLANGPYGPGPVQLHWAGCDSEGGRVPPGVYLLRSVVDGQICRRKVHLVK
ncbi:hypothetical protein ACFL6M_03750 [Candidatus Eisenbacteria bacterium]|uniref:FlgD Ig-like domain-containing protein n=1 Tax=Eiseniibacteriota bacterium TaxID=2212470 RepID=A0ABV6YKI7_UNCEI